MERLWWYVKQLIPCMYRSVYGQEGKVIYRTWRMWLGHCFSDEWVQVGTEVSPNLQKAVGGLRDSMRHDAPE